jgi:predicted nuclease of predicted toxin-antitoxin system
MRLLLDQGTPLSSAVLLRERGFDATHVGEIGFAQATDRQILERAAIEGRVVVTLDADFHTLLAVNELQRPSVVRIRIERLKAVAFAETLLSVLDLCHTELEDGAAVSVNEDKSIRVRRLPLI